MSQLVHYSEVPLYIVIYINVCNHCTCFSCSSNIDITIILEFFLYAVLADKGSSFILEVIVPAICVPVAVAILLVIAIAVVWIVRRRRNSASRKIHANHSKDADNNNSAHYDNKYESNV